MIKVDWLSSEHQRSLVSVSLVLEIQTCTITHSFHSLRKQNTKTEFGDDTQVLVFGSLSIERSPPRCLSWDVYAMISMNLHSLVYFSSASPHPYISIADQETESWEIKPLCRIVSSSCLPLLWEWTPGLFLIYRQHTLSPVFTLSSFKMPLNLQEYLTC